MEEYDYSQLHEDIDAFVAIARRIQKYVNIEEILKLVAEEPRKSKGKHGSLIIGEATLKRRTLKSGVSITDRIISIIREKQAATYDDIYEIISKDGEESLLALDSKEASVQKHRIRGIVNSLKQRKRIDGDGRTGFKIHSMNI